MTSERATTWRVTGLAVAVSVVMRLRMLWSPVTVDEGGYLAVARGWAHGAVLYRDVWVDRPQGLLVLFRVWDWISGGNTESIRVMAMLFGALLVVSTAIIVRELAGDTAARFAAVICAVISSAPVLEGYAANAELLSGAVAAAGLAVAVLAPSKRRVWWWFFASGVLAGLALSLKQSGFDGLATVGIWLLAVVFVSGTERRAAWRAIAMVSAGVLVVLAALAVHGALTGWSRWWAAVAGYRLQTQSAFAAADWHNLAATAPYAAVVFGAAALVGVQGSVIVVRRLRTQLAGGSTERVLQPAPLMLVVWLLASVLGFLIGGGFWRHYWMLLAAPFSALAGVGLVAIPRPRVPLLASIITPCLIISAWVYTGSTTDLLVRAASDPHAVTDQRVAAWFTQHRAPGQSLYAMCASAGLYADAHQDPGYPFLWFLEVHDGANAQNRLVDYLDDPARAPTYVAVYQTPKSCDDSGRVARIVASSYRQVAIVSGVAILVRDGAAASTARPKTGTP
ncbi:MAG: hypothetical protein JWM34_4318 [Ilumatobacteraceae bacterium]|nr:hypothetical protein [Ilumatobacteraceae bacterium]